MPDNTRPNPARRVTSGHFYCKGQWGRFQIRGVCQHVPCPRQPVYCVGFHLCYGCTTLETAAWQAMGLVYTYVVHIIPKFVEEGCTATLYMHGWSHTWFNPRTPMLHSDDTGERDLRVATRYALVTSTRQGASISESLKHELYEKFCVRKRRSPVPKFGPLSFATLFWRLAWLLPMQ